MPIPKPTKGESRKDFISRCMLDNVMVDEHPDEKQRAAICGTSFDDKEAQAIEAIGFENKVKILQKIIDVFKRVGNDSSL